MIIIDSSIWISYFCEKPTPSSRKLDNMLSNREPIGIIPIILTEVLSGFREQSDYNSALSLMNMVPIIAPTKSIHIEASNLYRNLRRAGITISGIVDCIIAQTCIETDSFLFSLDKDFQKIARHSRLRLIEIEEVD